ncbi:helix-turn-helix domain-containing protein [Chitinophaga polysaccharea]|uniref:helix-turn-helix domain-containing protein n=1 Tax=Chitinophaga polysaccharea TaxID=1293035 RepID=UPI0035E464E4
MTLGEKVRNRRIEKGMLQIELAELMGVSESSVTLWENNKSQPGIQLYPKVIEFLGYFPFTLNTDKLSGRITMYRYMNGLTQASLAKMLSVNEINNPILRVRKINARKKYSRKNYCAFN